MNQKMLAIVLAVTAASTMEAQVDTIPFSPGQPVHDEGFLLVHDDGTFLQAFSAFAQEWQPIAPTGSVVHGTGDWCAVVQTPAGLVRAYSARVDAFKDAPILAGSAVLGIQVHDDVALVLVDKNGSLEVLGYSAQINDWDTQPLSSTSLFNTDIAVSRFAIGVHDVNGPDHFVFGFGAREGRWQTTGAIDSPTLPMRAVGNTIIVEHQDSFDALKPKVFAFSGVHNEWARSPERWVIPWLEVDHNVAFVRTVSATNPNRWSPCAYSAYTNEWGQAAFDYDDGAVVSQHLRDNLVVLGEGTGATREWIATGARPHTRWVRSQPAEMLHLTEDAVVVENDAELFGFSGLAGQAWITQAKAVGSSAAFAGPDHLTLVADPAGTLYSFTPTRNRWSAGLVPGGSVSVEDAVSLVRVAAADVAGLSVRSNTWQTATGLPATSITSLGGSLAAVQSMTAGSVGDLMIWDSRLESFEGPFSPGAPSAITSGRNLLVFETAGATFGYSLQRSQFENISGIPLAVSPTAEENVAWMVDVAGMLVGYGSAGDVHAWYSYPDGTEYHALAEVGAPVAPTDVRYSVRAEAGDVARIYYALIRLPVGIPLPAAITGVLWLPIPKLLQVAVATGTNVHLTLPLPTSPPLALQVWLQALVAKASGLPTPFVASVAPEPTWTF